MVSIKRYLMKSGLLRYYFLFGLVLPIFLQLPLKTSGQQIKIDSLQLALKYANEDSNRITILNEISDAITWQGYFAKSNSFAFRALDLSQKIHYKKGVVDATNNIGINYYYQDDYAKSLDQCFNAYKIADSIGYKKGMATALLGIGEVYQDEGDDSSTLKEDRASFKLYQDIGYELGMADVQIDMGWSYNNLGKDSVAFEKGKQALQLYEKVGNKDGVAAALDLMGKVYEDRGDNSNALQNYAQSLSLKREIEDKDGVATSLVYVAKIYLKEKKLKDALENANNSIAVSREINSSNDVMEAERVLSDIYLAKGNIGEGMQHYKKYTHLQDSIYGPKNTKKVVQAQLNFEFEMKRAMEKAKREKEDAIYQQELIGLAVFSLFLLFIISLLLLIRRQKNIISEKRNQILLLNLIKGGENTKVEFKSSLRYDVKRMIASAKALEFTALKTVAAFLNTEGGTLIIGADDDKNILGLENTDFLSFSKSNKKDEWSKHLDNLIQNYFGNAMHSLVKAQFIEIEDKTVASIQVKKSPQPVWIKNDKSIEELYIRRTASSIALQGHEAVSYINLHW